MAAPDAWREVALVNINDGTTDIDVATIVETIDFDQGDKDGEGVPNVKGGRIWKFTPEADTSITFEGYPISTGDKDGTTATGLSLFFHGGTDATPPFSVINSRTRNTFTVTVMYTDGTATSATSSVLSGNFAYRLNFANCYFVSCKPSFTDQILKATFKFKCPAFTKAGVGNITEDAADGTASMPTI